MNLKMKQTNPLKSPLTSKEILHKHKKASELEEKQKELLLEKIKELFQKKSPHNDTLQFTDKYGRGVRIIVETDDNCPFSYGIVWRMQNSHIYFKEPPWDREFKIRIDNLPNNSLEKILKALPSVPNANKDFHKNFLR